VTVAEHFGFNLGNAIKYIWRAGLKSTDPIEDLRKAAWYIDREIGRLSANRIENFDSAALFCRVRTRDAQEGEGGTPGQVLYDEYKRWCEQTGRQNPHHSQNFSKRMEQLGKAKRHTKVGNFYPVVLLPA
jgi:hypothetical protein